MSPIGPDSLLAQVLPRELGRRVLPSLEAAELSTLEDLYECIASVGGNWYRAYAGISREDAVALTDWLDQYGQDVGQVTARFYPPGMVPAAREVPALAQVPSVRGMNAAELSGEAGSNRAHDGMLQACNDAQAIEAWLRARAVNPNTFGQYRKESERFLLWCTTERGKALSSIGPDDAALYPRWLEALGRTEPEQWSRSWRVAQQAWIGPKNVPRMSPDWKPFNGPLSVSSRKTAMTVVRLLFGFLVRTGYLRFNPFEEVSSKVRFLPGEGAPKEFADRSLTDSQWNAVMECLDSLPESESRSRLRLVLALGKGLGMRAAEMIAATAGWIVVRRIGDEDMTVIEIVGKGDKVRRLPFSRELQELADAYLADRGEAPLGHCSPDTPLLANLGVGRRGAGAGISRSGLYRSLTDFFERAAIMVEARSAADAAKLRAGSTHWLRHTFATTALRTMDINVVQNAMGHASIGTTSRYLTPEEAEIARAIGKSAPALSRR